MTDALRVIGTSYQGKEPFEYTADVLRNVVRAAGAEYGFETCLTSRPYTARTLVDSAPGAMQPGRGPAVGADRAIQDLADGLSTLASAGFRVEPVDPAGSLAAPTERRVLLAGPLPAASRWAPSADRLVHGAAFRHVIIDAYEADEVICLDPLVGGYTAVLRADLAGPGVEVHLVEPPAAPIDPAVLARRCLAQGAAWRTAETGADRDGAGLATLAADTADTLIWTSGGATRRLRLSLANYALLALRSGALLGFCAPLNINQLALADLLQDVVGDCRAAQAADADLGAALLRLSRTVDGVSELYQREAAIA